MEKSAEAFRTISEVADILQTPAHVLRFWESRFLQIKPVKRAGGRRYYRPSDIALLSGIRRLLHDDGMTIRGVQKILREQGVRHVASLGSAAEEAAFVEVEEEIHTAEVHHFPVRAAASGESDWAFATDTVAPDDAETPPLGAGDAAAALHRAERLRVQGAPITASTAIARLRDLPSGSLNDAAARQIRAAFSALRERIASTAR
ncbi:MerR family transcriptional regulator [Falsirhodobacter xinxiangensis]|uniref:MerR family transcriptional regulator n=1 Tax=Falsirhodobacter xinxiangensis TaxID=2530049 RepID=UPI001FEAC8DD|nr:MerR family transcriptional regulator [Rhodobacter xinxiangensis]